MSKQIAASQGAGLLANGNFRLYFGARVVSQLGDQVHVFAISWFVLDLTRSSFHMATLLAVNALAVMTVSLFGGIVADRISRKVMMVVTDLVQAAVLLGLVGLQHGHLLTIGALYAGTVIMGLCSGIFAPSASAIVPGIVAAAHVPAAVAAGQSASNICTIVGMLMGGVLYKLMGITGVLLVNAVSFVAAAAMEGALRVQAMPGGASAAPAGAGARIGAAVQRLARDLSGGIRQVRADRAVFGMLAINTVFNLVALPVVMVYLPYLFNVILGASPVQAAVSQATTWGGIILGSAAAARLLQRHRPDTLIAMGLLIMSINLLNLVWLVPMRAALGVGWMVAACTAGNAVAGFAAGCFNVPLYALFHARSVDEFRGRFWGLENGLRTAAMCAGYFVAGTIAERFPLELVFAGTALVIGFLSFAAFRLRAAARGVPAAPPR